MGRLKDLLLGLGVTIITLGAYLPWLRERQSSETVFIGYSKAVEAGFTVLEQWVVLAVALVCLGAAARRSDRLRAITVLFGSGTTLFACYWFLRPGDSLVGFGAMFVPETGWYLTGFGALLLLVAGAADAVEASEVSWRGVLPG
jgi:hypothetical protein